MKHKIPRIMIAGTNSGCGKTSITCALLRALSNKRINAVAFKSGPDYIDPLFHEKIVGSPSRSLDFFLCGQQRSAQLFARNALSSDIAIVEGVMGYYDGMGGNTAQNSSYEIAQYLSIPVVLVVNAEGMALSVAALVKGFADFMPGPIAGVILNRVSPGMLAMYREIIETHTGIAVLGCMPKEEKVMIQSRHLGLVTAGEIDDLQAKVDALAQLAAEHIDLDKLVSLAQGAPELEVAQSDVTSLKNDKAQENIRLGMSRDEAFCFVYPDALDDLKQAGVEVVEFSPLHDTSLPANLDALYLCGGYPELYLEQLSANKSMLESIGAAHKVGMPIWAECGGFMYLGDSVEDVALCGVIPMHSTMTQRLQNFGYITLIAQEDTMLLAQGESVTAHEFHYSKCSLKSNHLSLTATKTSGKHWSAGYCKDNIFALYPHINLAGHPRLINKLVVAAKEFRNEQS